MIVDFCFRIGGTLVAAGFGEPATTGRPFAVVDAAGAIVAAGPPVVLAHRRPGEPGGAGAEAAGVLLVFAETERVDGTLRLVADDLALEVVSTGEDLAAFAALAGDEAVTALLAAIGTGAVPPVAGEGASPLFERARRRVSPSALETETVRAAIERVAADPAVAAGVVTGWLIPAVPDAAPAATLVALTPGRIAPVEAAFSALAVDLLAAPRTAAAAIAAAGGPALALAPGFLATFAAPPTGATPAVALLLEAEGRTLMLARAADVMPYPAVAARFGALAQKLGPDVRKRLRAGLTGTLAAPPAIAPGAAGEEGGARLLVVEHDGRARGLREVIGVVAAAGFGEVVLAGVTPDDDVANAIAGAGRERHAPRVIVGAAGAAALAAAARAGTTIVWARSSMIVQHDVLPFLGAGAKAGRIALWDPAPRPLAPTPKGIAAAVARRQLAFAIALAGAAAATTLGAAALLSVPGRLLWAFAALPEGAVEGKSLSGPYFLGDSWVRPDRLAAAGMASASALASAAAFAAAATVAPLDFDLATIAAHIDGRDPS